MNPSVLMEHLTRGKAPPRIAAIIGKTFNRLVVIGYAGYKGHHHAYVECRCVCGVVKIVGADHLRIGRIASCGCLRLDHPNRTVHGHASSSSANKSAYQSWKSMSKRCNNPNDSRYKHYGGRGIKVCERWRGKNGFVNFLEDMGESESGMSLERIDNNVDYCPSNCKWIPRADQSKNRRHNWKVVVGKEVITAREATRRLGVGRNVIATNLRLGGYSKNKPVPISLVCPAL